MHLLPSQVEMDPILLVMAFVVLAIVWLVSMLPDHHDGTRGDLSARLDRTRMRNKPYTARHG
jgi:hypothetical protein